MHKIIGYTEFSLHLCLIADHHNNVYNLARKMKRMVPIVRMEKLQFNSSNNMYNVLVSLDHCKYNNFKPWFLHQHLYEMEIFFVLYNYFI